MATISGQSARTNAIISVVSVIGILVLVNVIGIFIFGRLDLTDNKRFTLSEVSKQAVRDLDGLDVQVFISKDLPNTIQIGWGQERDIRGVDRELLDKLAEYQSHSNGNMSISIVTDDVEEKAAKAKLELFTGRQAEVSGEGRLEFKKYALGATFQYRDQLETFPLAIEPEFFEFEITKILLRLKEKYEKSAGLKDVLDAGKAFAESVKACADKLASYQKKDTTGGLGALVGGGDVFQTLRMERAVWKKECDPVEQRLASLDQFKAKNMDAAQLAVSGRAFVEILNELTRDLEGTEKAKIYNVLERIAQLAAVVDRDHETLKNSPGRKAIGFLCASRTFCPFAEQKSLINPQIAGLLGEKNPLVQNFIGQVKQIEDQINLINEQIRRGLFTRKGLEVKRVDSSEDIPEDVEVLVVYGPERPLSERDLYNIDQFLLSGRSVIFFLNVYDVAVYNVKGGEGFDFMDMSFDELHRETRPSNVADFLKNYGVDVRTDLVLEPRSHETITVIQLQRQGQFTIQSQREFPYPLLPTFMDLDRSHVLVRRLASITMPFATVVGVTEEARLNPALEITELVKSSKEAIATNENFPLSPPQLVRYVATMKPNGPVPVAVVLKGEFTSYFKDKPVPQREEDAKTPEKPKRDSGSGRLLVVGSNLGLENLSTEKVFEGFNLGQLTSGNADFFTKLKTYVANFQNWQLRLSQLAPIIQDNLDFIFNCLDWGVQKEALVDIRSKSGIKRPIVTLSPAAQTALALGLIVGLPAAFALFGLIRFASRKGLKRTKGA